jgi:hypothetical protein
VAVGERTIFSFVVDDDPVFVYEGWHLARSLIEHCGGEPASIVVHCTPDVDEARRAIFVGLGCHVREIARFGDGRYCNKLNQLESLKAFDCDRAVLLDADMIAVADLRPFLRDDAVLGKIVDLANPPLATLSEIADLAKLQRRPAAALTDANVGETYLGNCNGGFYSVPRAFMERLSDGWREWALWLLDSIEPLRRSGHAMHVDQVSFWLAIQQLGLPFDLAPSNVNYYTHLEGEHRYFDARWPLALLHYHTPQIDVLGKIIAKPDRNPAGNAAVAQANRQIAQGFNNRVFWDMRYRLFPERGSGVGSRDGNLAYKRALLAAEGVEAAASVLDVGCGDLEVVRAFNIPNYLGLDQSASAIEIARRARPDWQFRLAPATDLPSAEMVLCFEVLIHQKDKTSYDALIALLAAKTGRSLIVSGYDADRDAIRQNPMVFFHEPLPESLAHTGRFKSVREIGRHTDVVIYRCDV